MSVHASRYLSLLLVLVCQSYGFEESSRAVCLRAAATMRRALAQMPKYLCTATVTRLIGEGNPVHFSTAQRFRLEVAVIEGKEMFSLPGGQPFRAR